MFIFYLDHFVIILFFKKIIYKSVIYLRGNNQSPFGSFARISILPYLNENDFLVVNLALTIGGKIRAYSAFRLHS